MPEFLTTREAGEILRQPEWRIRRVVDAVDCGLARAGLYRLIPRSQLGVVEQELSRRGWLPVEAGDAAEKGAVGV